MSKTKKTDESTEINVEATEVKAETVLNHIDDVKNKEHKAKKSQRLISLKEFLIGSSHRKEYIAGFKMFLKLNYPESEYMSSDDWSRVFNEYKNRDI